MSNESVVITHNTVEGDTRTEQWSVLTPDVSPVGVVTGWQRQSAESGDHAWKLVAEYAAAGVTARAERRTITVTIDAWWSPEPPATTSEDDMGCEHDSCDRSTCGTCQRRWCNICNPTPAARCPYEYDHAEFDDEVDTAPVEITRQAEEAPVCRIRAMVNDGPEREYIARPTVFVPSSGYTSGDYETEIGGVTLRYSLGRTYRATYRYRALHITPQPDRPSPVVFDYRDIGGPIVRVLGATMGAVAGRA